MKKYVKNVLSPETSLDFYQADEEYGFALSHRATLDYLRV